MSNYRQLHEQSLAENRPDFYRDLKRSGEDAMPIVASLLAVRVPLGHRTRCTLGGQRLEACLRRGVGQRPFPTPRGPFDQRGETGRNCRHATVGLVVVGR